VVVLGGGWRVAVVTGGFFGGRLRRAAAGSAGSRLFLAGRLVQELSTTIKNF